MHAGGQKKKKKKKLRLRHNQTGPYTEPPAGDCEHPDSPAVDSSFVDTPRRQLPQLKITRGPPLDHVHEDGAGEEDGLCVGL